MEFAKEEVDPSKISGRDEEIATIILDKGKELVGSAKALGSSQNYS